MTNTGIDSIDRTLHKTNEWLAAIADHLRAQERKDAYTALRSVLHALRDRLPVATVASLGAQLPMLVRGVYYEGWHPAPDGKPASGIHTADEFFALVERDLPRHPNIPAETAVRAVFTVLAGHLDPSETEKVIHVLPRRIQDLWKPEPYARDT